MFKFSTNTILNNFAEGAYHEAVIDAVSGALHIHRLGKFNKDNVTKIFKREGTDGTPGTASITCDVANFPSKGTTETAAGIYRLKLYVKLSGNNDAYYANDFVFKGKPYVYEFEVKESAKTAEDVAKAAEAAINRLASRFNDKVFKVTRSGADLELETVGADNVYRNITECVLLKYDATISSALVGGEYVDIVEGEMEACVNPFGNYTQLLKDLRLPTVENTSWTAINADDKPALGTVYNQYMIYMCVNRGIMGGDAVGEVVKSVTAHSIWVPQDKASDFEALLTSAGLPTPAEYDADKLSNEQDDAHAFAPADGVMSEVDITVTD